MYSQFTKSPFSISPFWYVLLTVRFPQWIESCQVSFEISFVDRRHVVPVVFKISLIGPDSRRYFETSWYQSSYKRKKIVIDYNFLESPILIGTVCLVARELVSVTCTSRSWLIRIYKFLSILFCVSSRCVFIMKYFLIYLETFPHTYLVCYVCPYSHCKMIPYYVFFSSESIEKWCK